MLIIYSVCGGTKENQEVFTYFNILYFVTPPPPNFVVYIHCTVGIIYTVFSVSVLLTDIIYCTVVSLSIANYFKNLQNLFRCYCSFEKSKETRIPS